jgi:hypothetical protein
MMSSVFRRRKHPSGPSAALALSEATAMLDGRLRTPGRESLDTPPWVWINELAHASWNDLVRLANRRGRGTAWEGAMSYLARELHTQAGTADGLLGLQRHALIPLELELLAGQTPPPATPLELTAIVHAEIDRLRATSQKEDQNEPRI